MFFFYLYSYFLNFVNDGLEGRPDKNFPLGFHGCRCERSKNERVNLEDNSIERKHTLKLCSPGSSDSPENWWSPALWWPRTWPPGRLEQEWLSSSSSSLKGFHCPFSGSVLVGGW